MPKGTPKLGEAFLRKRIQLIVREGNLDLSTVLYSLLAKGEFWVHRAEPQLLHSFFKKRINFIYFWLCWVIVAVRGLSLVAASRGYSSLWCGSFSCCGAQALGTWASVVVAHGLSSCGTRA